jgi:hypothetical protein
MKTPIGTFRLPRLALAAAALGLLLVAVVPTIAQAAPKSTTSTASHDAVLAPATATPCDLACVKSFGDQRIADRLTSLNTASGKISDLITKLKLTGDAAAPFQALITQINTNISGLQSLQTKLDAETTVPAARDDVKNIYLQFRIYAVFLPRTRHVVWLDVMTLADQKLRTLQPKIETAIDQDTAHKDQLNSLYADFKTQLQQAEAQIDGAQGELPVLTPSTFNEKNGDYKTAWSTFTTDTKNAHAALKQARSDLHQIVTILKADRGTATATP